MRGRLLIGGMLAGLLAFGPPGPSPAEKGQARVAEQAEAARKVPAELIALNSASRRMYASARKLELSTIPDVIVVSGDDLILHRKGKRTVATVIPAEYHALKSVAHTALGLSTYLAYEGDRPLTEERRKTLTEYQALLTAAGPVVEKFGFDADTLARQKRILGRAGHHGQDTQGWQGVSRRGHEVLQTIATRPARQRRRCRTRRNWYPRTGR